MARLKTLRERVQEIIRRYKHVNKKKFLYNRKPELKRRYRCIRVWYLIHDVDRGYSIMKMEYKRRLFLSVSEWTRLHAVQVEGYDSLYFIFTQKVLPAINNKGGNRWSFTSLLAWAGLSDSRPATDSKASRRGNKTVKKGSANARRRNRRRH